MLVQGERNAESQRANVKEKFILLCQTVHYSIYTIFFVQFMDSLSACFMDILTKIIKRPNDWQSCVYANVKRRVLW